MDENESHTTHCAKKVVIATRVASSGKEHWEGSSRMLFFAAAALMFPAPCTT